MPEKWTGEIKKLQHIYGISMAELAEAAGMNPKYLSTVLHSETTAKTTRAKIESAVKLLVTQRKAGGSNECPS